MSETVVSGKIAVTPQHRKFIEWRENLPPDTPLCLPGRSPVSLFITGLLHIGLTLMEYPRKRDDIPFFEGVERYGDCIPFSISGPLANYDVFLLLDNVARHLHEFIPAIMHEEVNARVAIGHHIGLSEKIIIEDFMSETGLFELIDFDGVKKRQQRFRSARSYVNYNRYKGNAVIRRQKLL